MKVPTVTTRPPGVSPIGRAPHKLTENLFSYTPLDGLRPRPEYINLNRQREFTPLHRIRNRSDNPVGYAARNPKDPSEILVFNSFGKLVAEISGKSDSWRDDILAVDDRNGTRAIVPEESLRRYKSWTVPMLGGTLLGEGMEIHISEVVKFDLDGE